MINYKIILPFPPSLNRLWRSTHKGGKTRVYRSRQYKLWVRQSDSWWMAQKLPGRPKIISESFKAKITLHPPDRRRRDSDNFMKAIMDFLQRIEVIRDDSDCREHTIAWGETGKATACCVVEVESYQD